ncbi:MAG TPA: hypothetical protein VGE21_14075 [Flavobacteriales bacterium]
MDMDLEGLARLAWEHAGNSASAIAGALGLGLLVTIVVIIVYGKLGVFRRQPWRAYHWAVKLWIPYLLVIGMLFAFKLGALRAIRSALTSANKATVDALYDHAISPYIGDAQARQVLLARLQGAVNTTQELGNAITAALQERITPKDPDAGVTQKIGALLAGKVIEHYEADITAAVVYGIYLKSDDYLALHRSGRPMDYHRFKQGVDELQKIDLVAMEASIRENLSTLTGSLIERQYRSMFKGTLILGLLLLLLPLAEWGIYRWVMYRRALQEVTGPEEGVAPPEG